MHPIGVLLKNKSIEACLLISMVKVFFLVGPSEVSVGTGVWGKTGLGGWGVGILKRCLSAKLNQSILIA